MDKFKEKREELHRVDSEIADCVFYDDPECCLESLDRKRTQLEAELDKLNPGWKEKEAEELERAITKLQHDIQGEQGNADIH